MYRLRTADKGRPLIISDKVISEYADNDIDTLHKKNLLALGEDRYLTTLMTKHFPSMSYKFVPDAYASTAAPETWGVLLSQRRRWINSTIHNLVELAWLDDLCGFCCFGMRFVVMVDLLGTVILPATCVYLGYLIYRLASHSGPIPYISIGILAGVYGLQAIIFILKRQWQHVGWMIIYLMGFLLFSFVLPLYSFWHQDDFSWGNTRMVIGEKGDKKVVAMEDEGFDPRSIPLQRWDDYALANNLPGRRGDYGRGDHYGLSQEKFYPPATYSDNEPAGMEMDDMHSMYSSVKHASTVLTGFPQGRNVSAYMPPASSPAPLFSGYGDHDFYRNSHMTSPQQHRMSNLDMNASRYSVGMGQSTENLLLGGLSSRPASRSPLYSRPNSTNNVLDFRGGPMGPDDGTIVEAVQTCLTEVDLDRVTKKQG